MMITKSLVAVVLFILFQSSLVVSQRKPTSSQTQKLSLDAEYLPKGFVGDDIASVYKQMHGEMGPKGEYESSNNYRARIAKAVEKYKDRTFIFRFKPPHMPGVNDDYAFYFTEYNADTQELSVDIPSKGSSGNHEVNIGGYITGSRYRASNRFGVSTSVTRYTGHLFDIVFNWKSYDINVKFKVPPSQARIVPDRISVLFIGVPKVIKDSESMVKSYEPMPLGATMDNPYEDNTWTHQLYIDIKGIWIYDRITMKILAKLNQ